MFGKIMQDAELCKELLQRILPDLEIDHIEYPEAHGRCQHSRIFLLLHLSGKHCYPLYIYFQKYRCAFLFQEYPEAQKSIRLDVDAKSVRLDVYVRDADSFPAT